MKPKVKTRKLELQTSLLTTNIQVPHVNTCSKVQRSIWEYCTIKIEGRKFGVQNFFTFLKTAK